VFLRGLNGFQDHLGRGVGKGGEDAAGMEPTSAELAEDLLPVEVARSKLADGGVTAVGDAGGAADAKTALGEVEADAGEAPNASKGAI